MNSGLDERLVRRQDQRERRRRQRRFVAIVVAIVFVVAAVAGIALAMTAGHGKNQNSAPPPPPPPSPRVADYTPRTAVVKGSKPNEKASGLKAEGDKQTRTSAVSTSGHPRAPKPRIVLKLIPYPAKRRAEMAAYSLRHYGIDSWHLVHPRVIIEHYTVSETFSSVYNTFAPDTPDGELGELPGDCSHFVVDKDGTIYQLVPLGIMCRHTVGLNYTAIGIEHVGDSDQQILSDPRQLQASLALTVWLMQTEHIQLRNVIGHNESLTSPYHKELDAPWRCQTHGDWVRADMDVYRAKLAALARHYGVPVGPPAVRVTPHC